MHGDADTQRGFDMKIYGFQKTTLLDYPEHVAATIFTGGCNFRCPYCQNGGLVTEPGRYGEVPEEEVWKHLKKRRGVLDGVCITGGEATLQPDLEDFIRRVKEMGYAVKLDTNGYRPEILQKLLQEQLLDYVAMDIKASKENYAWVAGWIAHTAGKDTEVLAAERNDSGNSRDEESGFDIGRIEESVKLLQDSEIPYEFRTTAVKGLHTVEEFERIGEWLAGSRVYFIQSYREEGEILCGSGLSSFEPEELKQMKRLAEKYIARVELRGVEA